MLGRSPGGFLRQPARIVDAAEIGFRRESRVRSFYEPLRAKGNPDGYASPRHLNASSATGIYREPEPRLFSFNNPYGACQRCQGSGNTIDFESQPDHSGQAERH